MKSSKEIKGCGKDTCLVEVYSDLIGEDVDIQVCGEYCPYHKEIHYCKECKQTLEVEKKL